MGYQKNPQDWIESAASFLVPATKTTELPADTPNIQETPTLSQPTKPLDSDHPDDLRWQSCFKTYRASAAQSNATSSFRLRTKIWLPLRPGEPNCRRQPFAYPSRQIHSGLARINMSSPFSSRARILSPAATKLAYFHKGLLRHFSTPFAKS